MRYLATLLFGLSLSANAQNWALLNPAYKYNYSNDGTDTISDQVFVTHIDTLGPDSFRYALNRIGVVCDTCPAGLGGPCDGCYVRVNQPQFLGFDCVVAQGDWLFIGPDTFLIRSDASVGADWTYNASEGITATVDAEWPDSTFTIPDTLRRILLSSGDTLILSNSFGITRFDFSGAHVDLLGVEGAGVGRLFPDPLAYFDYQPGDHLIYKVNSVWWYTPNGGPWFHAPHYYFHEVVITGRADLIDTVNYTTSVARSIDFTSYPGWLIDEPNWTPPLEHWSFSRTGLLSDHPILSAYPGEVLDTAICWSSDYDAGFIVRQGITADGRSVLYSQTLGTAFGAPTSGFDSSQAVMPDLFPSINELNINIRYEEGLGIRKVEFKGAWLGASLSVELVGAIIGGDTVIPPPVITWQVGLPEEQSSDITIFPNPAADAFTVSGIIGVKTLQIHDLEGRLVRTARMNSEGGTINVRDLQPGVYLLRIDGHRPQRFIIAR